VVKSYIYYCKLTTLIGWFPSYIPARLAIKFIAVISFRAGLGAQKISKISVTYFRGVHYNNYAKLFIGLDYLKTGG